MRRAEKRGSRALACLLMLFSLSGCAKDEAQVLPEESPAASPVPDIPETMSAYGPESRFTEPASEASFSRALGGRPSCPLVPIGDSLACAFGKKLVLLEADGSSRSMLFPEAVSSILGVHSTKDGSDLVVALADGSLRSIDVAGLAVIAESAKAAAGASFALSGMGILRAQGRRIERIELPSLATMESAVTDFDIGYIVSNGNECLVADSSALLSRARFIPARDFADGVPYLPVTLGDSAASAERDSAADGRIAWAAPVGDAFLVLLSDGRAILLREGEEIEYLPGFYDPRLGGFSNGSRAALSGREGGLRLIAVDEEGKAQSVETGIRAESAISLEGGWLWQGRGKVGFARSSGTPLWETALPAIPVFPPIAWRERIALPAANGVFLFPALPDPQLEPLLAQALLDSEAEASINESLGRLRPGDGPAELEPYLQGIRKTFIHGWRISVFSPQRSGVHSMRVDGEGDYRILAFDEDGSELRSNFGYELEDSIELSMLEGKKYAIAFSPVEAEGDGRAARLDIRAK